VNALRRIFKPSYSMIGQCLLNKNESATISKSNKKFTTKQGLIVYLKYCIFYLLKCLHPMDSIKIVYLYSTPRQICPYHCDVHVPTLNILKAKATDVPTVENTRATIS
jgi:hypothetical protein